MGVTGLWETLQTSGKTVTLSSLRNKTLAVDVSLWMYQAVNGVFEREEVNQADTHLIVLFNRICILLKHGIRPIFVFDGIPPDVKKKVIWERRKTHGQSSSAFQHHSNFPARRNGTQSQFARVIVENGPKVALKPAKNITKGSNKQESHVEQDLEWINELDTGNIPSTSTSSKNESIDGDEIISVSARKVRLLRKMAEFDPEYCSSRTSSTTNLLRRQPGRTCNNSQDGIQSSYESHCTLSSNTDRSDHHEVQCTSSLLVNNKNSTNTPPRKNVKQKSGQVSLEKTAAKQRKRTKLNAICALSNGFRLPSTSSPRLAVKSTKLFPMFVSCQAAKLKISSSEKRKKPTSTLASPTKMQKVGEIIDLTNNDEAEVGENNHLRLVFDEEVNSGRESNDKGDIQSIKALTYSQNNDWRDLFPPENDTISIPPTPKPDISISDDPPMSQQIPLSSTQPSQIIRPKKQPLPLPCSIKENFRILMNMFGVPFVDSPGEAEAQCAYLEMNEKTDGTISDDADVLLFGGRKVYRNLFSKKAEPMEFNLDIISQHLDLDRDKLIAFAMLTGSDYSEGINGIGPVRALEILGEFGGSGLASLHTFAEWHKSELHLSPHRKLTGLKKSLLKHVIPDGFPFHDVSHAYFEPEVDTVLRKYCWAKPDFESLRRFARERFMWNLEKIEKLLQPLMKDAKTGAKQMRLDQFFKLKTRTVPPLQMSQRMGNAVEKMKERQGVSLPIPGKKTASTPKTKEENCSEVIAEGECRIFTA